MTVDTNRRVLRIRLFALKSLNAIVVKVLFKKSAYR